MKRSIIMFALISAVALGAVAPAAAAVSDAWITAKTKTSLLTNEGLQAMKVNVDTVDGRVTLHGSVPSPADKAKAEETARTVDGVKEVRNLLQVVPVKDQSAARTNDALLKERVTVALKADRALKDTKITVQSVNDGVVLLAGDANTISEHLRAVEDASRVPGVRRVASEIKSPNESADAEIRRDQARQPAKDNAQTVSGAASDMWTTSAVKLRLLADSNTPALDINVDTRDGVVTLFGIVPTKEAKQAAATEARKVDGVKQVVNEIQIVAKAKQDVVKAKDDDIEQSVEQAINKHPALDNADIKIAVENGVVRLTGTVPTEQDRLQAAVVARSTPGVRSVLPDDLRVGSSTK